MRELIFRTWNGTSLQTTALDAEGSVVMLSTGLRDMDGREVYEGDILEIQTMQDVPLRDRRAKVAYVDGAFRVREKTLYCALRRFRCRVIGNAYENPDLLAC